MSRTGRSEMTLGVLKRWYVLLLLCAVYALSIADRYAMSTVLEPVRIELHLTDSGVAFLTGTALALFYVSFGLPIGWLADRFSRRNIIALSVLAWSLMTGATGLSVTWGQLLGARIGVGVGEAGATPAGSSLLADYFSVRERPMALTVFALGAPLGSWLAAAVGGVIAQSWGWRTMFLALALPGALMSLLILATTKEPVRGSLDPDTARAGSALETWRYLIRHRTSAHLLAAVALTTLWGWGLLWWMPAFLARAYGMDTGSAGALLGRMHLIGGALATLGTALLIGQPRFASSRRIAVLLCAVLLLGSVVSVGLLATHSVRVTGALLWIFVPAIYIYIGPTLGLLNNLVPAPMRALALATSLFLANVCNLVIAPQLIGALSDAYGSGGDPGHSLRMAMRWLTPVGLWAAAHYWLCARALFRPAPAARAH